MGNGAGFFGRKKQKPEPPPRRDPITTFDGIMNSQEAKDRIIVAIKKFPPGLLNRWEQMIMFINIIIEPTEDNYDPLRIDITIEILKQLLKAFYSQLSSVQNDRIALMREYIPRLYDKHTVERCKRVSQEEREMKAIKQESYAYGELNYELFATIYTKINTIYGYKADGKFYDLGSGAGLLVYTATIIGNFSKSVGIENLKSLLSRGEKRLKRWESYKTVLPEYIRSIDIDWIEDDFIENNKWIEASFILLHWTAFSKDQRDEIAHWMRQCEEGTHVVSFTHPIPGNDFEILIEDKCETSWGTASFYFQEKQTKAQAIM
eukprot:gene14375-19280_t